MQISIRIRDELLAAPRVAEKVLPPRILVAGLCRRRIDHHPAYGVFYLRAARVTALAARVRGRFIRRRHQGTALRCLDEIYPQGVYLNYAKRNEEILLVAFDADRRPSQRPRQDGRRRPLLHRCRHTSAGSHRSTQEGRKRDPVRPHLALRRTRDSLG